MERLRNRLPHLLVIPAILLLCVGWLQPVLPHSCQLHSPCETMPCCAGKQAPDNGMRASDLTACPVADVPNVPAVPAAHTLAAIDAHVDAHVDAHAPAAPVFDPSAQSGHSRKGADCSTLLCFESQAPVIISLFEGLPVSSGSPAHLAPGEDRFASLLRCRLFRPPIS